jgi:iron complex outermembrane receptor protein
MKYLFNLFLFLLCFPSFVYSELLEYEKIEKITVLNAPSTQLEQVFTNNNHTLSVHALPLIPTTIGDAISTVAGVSQSGQGGLFQSYSIRGFSNARIKTEVDGIAIISDRRAGNSLSFLPAQLLSSINIQKGPQSALYGSDAMGGVVSLTTKSHDNNVGISVQPQDDMVVFHGSASSELLSANIVARKANEAHSADQKTPLNSAYSQLAGTVSADFIVDNINVYASVIGSNGNDIGKSSATYPSSQISDYLKDDHLLAQVTLSQQGSWKLQMFTHDQAWDTNTVRLVDNQINRTNLVEYSSTTMGASGLWRLDNTILGIDWLARNNININETEFDENNHFVWANQSVNASQNTYSAYLLQQFKVASLYFEAGARYDYLMVKQFGENKHDEHVSLSVSADYQLSENTKISGEAANGFRFPTVSELFFSGLTPRGNTQGNSDLKPEASIGLELALNHRFSDSVALDLSAYIYNIDDYIERYTLDDVRYYRNDTLVKMRGTEVSLNYKLNDSFTVKAALQKQWARDCDGQQIDGATPAAMKLSAIWQHNNWSINNYALYQFSRRHVGGSELPQDAELVIDSSIAYQVNRHLNVILAFSNLTDNLYTASADEDAPYQSERTARLSASWQF